jgi:sulfur-oxidizing protein SoxX
MRATLIMTAAGALLTAGAASAAPAIEAAKVDAAIAASWQGVPPEEAKRLQQDTYQAVCSQYRNSPPSAEVSKLIEAEKATIQLPESGKLVGDWKEGEKLAKSGYGGRIGKINPDDPKRPSGGNCYACHAMDPKEVAAGNLGPPLTGFGALRGNTPDTARYAYEKIYNAAAYFPCTNMPRFGYHGHLTQAQIADIVAYMLDPESPVNKK